MKKGLLVVVVALAVGAAFVLREHNPQVVNKPAVAIVTPKPQSKPEDLTGKQIIVFAFDGSKSLDMWQESLDFAQQMLGEGKPIHFTYFISGVYFITYQNREIYHPPQAPAGTSTIGYADSKEDIIKRINYINRAVSEGHEIGSHLNGHFDGSHWSAADWQQEFDQFDQLINAAKLNIATSDIIGFRAPDLGRNDYLWPVLKNHGFVYDTSTVGKLGEWPKKQKGLWEFAIPQIKFADTNSYLLSMDYNFYVKQTRSKDQLLAGTTKWQDAFDQMYDSYIDYFNNNYSTTKAPVFIAHHFSLWNNGVYWEALKKFAAEECGKLDVRCITYQELTNYLNSKAP